MVSCGSLGEVRTQIDRLDKQLVALLAERQGYVEQAVRFKRDVSEVAAPDRAAKVMIQAVAEAQVVGADPMVVGKVYQAMIQAFIAYETERHKSNKP